MRYKRPTIETVESEFVLLCGSGPGATNIGSPTVSDDAKEYSIWDEEIENDKGEDVWK